MTKKRCSPDSSSGSSSSSRRRRSSSSSSNSNSQPINYITTSYVNYQKHEMLDCGSIVQWLAHLEFELGDPSSNPGSRHYSTG